MKSNTAAVLLAVSALLLSFGSGYFFRKATCKPAAQGIRIDTVYLEKSLYVENPFPSSVSPAKPVTVRPDEVAYSEDSSMVTVAAEKKTYRDTLAGGVSYEAVVSGARPSLESIRINYPSEVITKTVTVSRPYEGWKLSLTSNTAVVQRNAWGISSQTAVELSYNTGPFHAGLQGGVLLEKHFDAAPPDAVPYLGARITVDILRLRR